jgi:hypothetical protein
MPVEDLHKAHLDHLPHEQRHIVDSLGDDHQFTGTKEFLNLLSQLNVHRVFLCQNCVTLDRG